MTNLVKELEALRDGLNARRKTGWGPALTTLKVEDLTEGLMNLVGTLITAYSAEDEMHAVQDDTPDVERQEHWTDPLPDTSPFKAGSPGAQGTERITVAALAELARAKAKFPEWPTDPIHAYAVVMEEVGEGIRAALQTSYRELKHPTPEAVREECIQSIAMLYRFMLNLDRYDWTPSKQHKD